VKNIELAVPAAAQLPGSGISPLSAATPGASGWQLPMAWCTDAARPKDPRLTSCKAAGFARVQAVVGVTKSLKTNNRKHVYMTRVNAYGYGASGPYPAREPA
jgi:hypothetical protein